MSRQGHRTSESAGRTGSGKAADQGISPSPDGGPLEFTIECRTHPTTQSSVRHPITINPDWSLSFPHDLEAERVAAAFGGYSSCLLLHDQGIKALRLLLGILTRQQPMPIQASPTGRWSPSPRVRCCRNQTYDTALAASRHVLSPAHQITWLNSRHRIALPEWLYCALLAGAESVWGSFQLPPPHDVDELVREPGGVKELWQVGIRPELIQRYADLVPGIIEPLPMRFYMGLAYGSVDPAWLSRTLLDFPDPDTAAWLANLSAPQDIGSDEEWASWLHLRVPHATVIDLIRHRVGLSDVFTMANTLNERPAKLARELAWWATAGFAPTTEQLLILRRYGHDVTMPHSQAIDLLVTELEFDLRGDPTDWRSVEQRTELAALLIVLGTRQGVLHRIRHGVRRVADLNQSTDRAN